MRSRPAAVRSNSMWEQQSMDYWKKHDPPKPSKSSMPKMLALLLLVLVCVGGTAVWMFVRPPVDTEGLPSPVSDAVRDQCHQEAVQSAWHQSSCENICEKFKNTLPKPISHRSCMDGCTYGTITTTKQVCSLGKGGAQDPCPASVDCASACSPYNDQSPRPTLKKNCQSNCAAITSAACLRTIAILHKHHTRSLSG